MKKIKQYLALAVMGLLIVACQQPQKKQGYTIEGDMGELSGKLSYSIMGQEGEPQVVDVVNGKFKLEGHLEEPAQFGFMLGDGGSYFVMYVENSPITVSLYMKDGYRGMKMLDGKVTGSTIHEHYTAVQKQESQFWDELQEKEALVNNPEALAKYSEEEQKEIKHFVKHFRAGADAIKYNFIKAHPKAYYSAVLSASLSHGRDSKGVKELIAAIDPSLHATTPVKSMLANAQTMSKDEVKLEDVFNVANVGYKVDNAFNGNSLVGITYLGVYSDNTICALTADGKILTIDKAGKKTAEVKANIEDKISSIAIDKQDRVHALIPLKEKVKQSFRGKTFERVMVTGIACIQLDKNGNETTRIKLEGAKGATGARIVDNKLMIADYSQGEIGIYELETGKKLGQIEDMRQCCGILDFSVTPDNHIISANLGAFRVEKFDMTGKKEVAFGSRGRENDNFHGCCNPVSVAGLSNGAIVTVEKDPTRVKIYSKTGAKVIDGISEMVKGCNYIPMIVDSNDNLYLASPDKGMIRCVAI